GNVLILDEPTNDLDLPTLRALEEALVAELPPEEGGRDVHADAFGLLRARVTIAPALVALPGERVALTRHFLQGAYFRYTPNSWELEKGVLCLEATELELVCAQVSPASDLEVCWRDVSESEARQARLVRSDDRWLLPGLGGWFDRTGFTFGDDLVVHVREASVPLFVFDRVSRFDRDEGPIARRNAQLVEAAIATLEEATEAWMSVERMVKLMVGRFDYRSPTPPDAFAQRLLEQDNRFTLSKDGREVRLSHFHHEETAHAYMARVGSPNQALGAFFEEYPPQGPEDRDKAVAYLEQLWRHTPRAELNGLTPAQVDDPHSKIVLFGRKAAKD
ncbi:MAG: hypothetical protein ACK46X_21260, partial [Candidatus Sericytochromatia bacterium]